jgi:hypothetical protein
MATKWLDESNLGMFYEMAANTINAFLTWLEDNGESKK